jgi:enoyl-CoA hydratase/carnithine racemase
MSMNVTTNSFSKDEFVTLVWNSNTCALIELDDHSSLNAMTPGLLQTLA